jgi:uncharacterized membrane protein
MPIHTKDWVKFIGVTNALWIPGRILLSLSVAALGFETIVLARTTGYHLGPGWPVIPCLPWLPAIPLVAGVFGVVWASCGMGLLARGHVAARILGTSLIVCAVLTVVPKSLLDPANLSLRAALFQILALAGIALLQHGREALPRWLEWTSRALLGISLGVFGLDVLLCLEQLAKQQPVWLPRPELWVEFCGTALILGGLAIMTRLLQRWVPAVLGLFVALWAVFVQLPMALDPLIVPNLAPDPNAWSTLLFAIALWGGLWTLVKRYAQEKRMIERPVYAGRVTGGSRRRPS